METAGNKDFEKETEKKGLGTPATRAAIIEKLVSSHYAVRKGKQILPTMEGRELVSILPEQLKSAAMTAQWENELLAVEKGKADSFRTKKQSVSARYARVRFMKENIIFTVTVGIVPLHFGKKTVFLPE